MKATAEFVSYRSMFRSYVWLAYFNLFDSTAFLASARPVYKAMKIILMTVDIIQLLWIFNNLFGLLGIFSDSFFQFLSSCFKWKYIEVVHN